jgi:hypothetical protein
MSNYNKTLLIVLLIFIAGFFYLLADKITKHIDLPDSKVHSEIDSSNMKISNENSNPHESTKIVYDAFSTIVGQSSNNLMPGEELEINAGIGAYSKAAEPKISINGVSVPLNDDGRATSRIKVNGTGVKSVPVMITYTKPDGTSVTKSIDVKYTVQKIPNPIFKVGSGKARMPANEFKSQQYCRAELENFDLDVRFNIVSATVYFSGSNFPNCVNANIQGNSLATLNSYISRCGPGSVITFENINVQGPDGIRNIDGKSIALY